MLRNEDSLRIARLKHRLHAKSKAEVIRRGIELVEKEIERRDRIARWRRAAQLVAHRDLDTLRDFRTHSLLLR